MEPGFSLPFLTQWAITFSRLAHVLRAKKKKKCLFFLSGLQLPLWFWLDISLLSCQLISILKKMKQLFLTIVFSVLWESLSQYTSLPYFQEWKSNPLNLQLTKMSSERPATARILELVCAESWLRPRSLPSSSCCVFWPLSSLLTVLISRSTRTKWRFE